jgi:hypothetical protein
MSSARTDLFIFIGVALATTIGLFVLHKWYGSYLDQRYHAEIAQAGPSEALLAARDEERKLLDAGKVPLEQAMASLAKGRPTSVAPAPSQDLSPVSGWIYARGFKPATAHPVRTAQPAARPRAEAPTQPAAATPPAEVAPPAAAPAPATPAATRQLRLKTEVVQPQVPR